MKKFILILFLIALMIGPTAIYVINANQSAAEIITTYGVGVAVGISMVILGFYILYVLSGDD